MCKVYIVYTIYIEHIRLKRLLFRHFKLGSHNKIYYYKKRTVYLWTSRPYLPLTWHFSVGSTFNFPLICLQAVFSTLLQNACVLCLNVLQRFIDVRIHLYACLNVSNIYLGRSLFNHYSLYVGFWMRHLPTFIILFKNLMCQYFTNVYNLLSRQNIMVKRIARY